MASILPVVSGKRDDAEPGRIHFASGDAAGNPISYPVVRILALRQMGTMVDVDEKKVLTQMGNQRCCGKPIHRLAELVAAGKGSTIEWDMEKMLCTNKPEINQLVRRQYRSGWEVV